MSLSFTVSEILLLGNINILAVLLCINQQTKFEVPKFTNSKDMIGSKI